MSRALGWIASVRFWAAVILAAAGVVAQPREARADVFDLLNTVCSYNPSPCGQGGQWVGIATACFTAKDEIGCALAFISATGSTAGEDAYKKYKIVIGCVQDDSDCDKTLKDAGVPEPLRSEAVSIVAQCRAIADVDDAIVCADLLLDSSFADYAGVKPPSFVDDLFDIYMALRDGDYVALIIEVGTTVACLVASSFTGGVDVCGLITTLLDIGNAIAAGFEAVAEFFGFGGGCPYKINDNCVEYFQVVALDLASWANLDESVNALLAGEKAYAQQRIKAFKDVLAGCEATNKKQFGASFGTGGGVLVPPCFAPPPADADKAWDLYTVQTVHPAWDKRIPEVLKARQAKINDYLAKLPRSQYEAWLEETNPYTREAAIGKARTGCLAASDVETKQVEAWIKAGRVKPGDTSIKLFAKADATCEFQIALRAIPTEGVHPCKVTADGKEEQVRAECNSGRSLALCTSMQVTFGKERVQSCDPGKGGDIGTAQTTLLNFAQWLGKQPEPRVKCIYGLAAKDPNALHCEDPAHTKQCMNLLAEQFKAQGYPKAGVAECKTVATAKRIKAVADAAKVAAAAPGAVVPPVKPGTPSLKPFGCIVDKFDAAIVVCGLVPDADQLTKIKAAVPGVAVRLCSPEESSTLADKGWVNEPCISRKAGGQFQEVIKPLDPGKPALTTPVTTGNPATGKVIPGGGGSPSGIPGHFGNAGPAKNPVKPSGGLGGGSLLDKKPAGPPGVPSNLHQPGGK